MNTLLSFHPGSSVDHAAPSHLGRLLIFHIIPFFLDKLLNINVWASPSNGNSS